MISLNHCGEFALEAPTCSMPGIHGNDLNLVSFFKVWYHCSGWIDLLIVDMVRASPLNTPWAGSQYWSNWTFQVTCVLHLLTRADCNTNSRWWLAWYRTTCQFILHGS